MEFIKMPKIPRLSREIIVTEKLDGTNAQIYIEHREVLEVHADTVALGESDDGLLLFAGSRNRWISLEKDNFGFARWVSENFSALIKLGPGRHFGEWWGQGIQRGYDLGEKRFSLFNTSRWDEENPSPSCCHVVPVLGKFETFDTVSILATMAKLNEGGSIASPGYMNPEGIVVFHPQSGHLFKKTFDDGHKEG